jgi:HlyD family secretion protein
VISEALQVRAQINEADIGRAQLGQKVEFTVNSFPGKKFGGTLSSISPQAYTESNVQIYDVIIQTDQKYNDLKAGMPANVNIIVDRRQNVLSIPKGAVNYAISHMNKMRAGGSGAATGAESGVRPGAEAGAGPEAGAGGGNAAGNRNRNNDGATGELKPGEQRAMVLVLKDGKNPVSRRVVLGLSDMRSYEVVSGLEEGETVVLGVSGASTTQPSAQGNMPFMGGNRVTVGPGAGGRR